MPQSARPSTDESPETPSSIPVNDAGRIFVEDLAGSGSAVSPRIEAAKDSVTAFVGRTERGRSDQPVLCNSWADFELRFGGLNRDSDLGHNVAMFFMNGGRDALIARTNGEDVSAALHRLSQATAIGLPAPALVCLPQPHQREDVPIPSWENALAWCVENRAMLLVDPPMAWTDTVSARSLAGGYGTLRSANAAFYYPRIEAPDQLDGGRRRLYSPSGAVAGLLARLAKKSGVWKMPGGLDARLRGTTGIAVELSSSDAIQLAAGSVNPIRVVPRSGVVAWGTRTSVDAGSQSEWRYIPVRRLALLIESSITSGLAWAAAETSDEVLWARLRLSVAAFLHELFSAGAFAGARPDEAWFVRCDENTTTTSERERGLVNLLIGIAPLRPREFVTLRIQIATKSGTPAAFVPPSANIG